MARGAEAVVNGTRRMMTLVFRAGFRRLSLPLRACLRIGKRGRVACAPPKRIIGHALSLLLAAISATGATLTGAFSPIATGSNVNLTAIGELEWVHWGLYTDTSVNRKGGVPRQISDFTVIANMTNFLAAYRYHDNFNGYSWRDGFPVSSVTNTPTGVWAYSWPSMAGSGFVLTVPADTSTKILQVFVGTYAARGRFEASLSDGSASAFVSTQNATVSNIGNGPGGVFTITFAAASAGQTLTVKWTMAQSFRPDGNVTLQAAALTSPSANNLPYVALTAPVPNANVAAPADLVLQAEASDFDGTISRVEFFAGADKLGEVTTSPYSIIWLSPPIGHHVLTAKATDNGGATSTSSPVEVFVHGTGGSLTGSVALPPVSANLTSEGTADWGHWGLETATSFNVKNSVVRQIPNFTKLGTNRVERYADNRTAFSWTDGTPVASTNGTTTGVFSMGVTNGFRITVPADTTTRRLRMYVGVYGAQGQFQAYLSDLSAAAYTDTSVSNVYRNSYAVYTLDYAAATAGQSLTVTYHALNLFDLAYGNVTWQAATLVGGGGGNAAPTVALTSPTNNAVFTTPATLTLQANASDSDGTIAKVEFYQGGTRLGEATTSPYAFTWSNVAAGTYNLTAVATDNLGASGTSAVVTVTVANRPAQPVTLLAPAWEGTRFRFSFASESGRIYAVQFTSSLNPAAWQSLTNVPGNGSLILVTDEEPTGGQRFYRVETQ